MSGRSMDDVEDRIREFFEENLQALQAEGGHPLAPDAKETALQQVLLYWRKLRGIAEKVTDTEVRLTLPEQLTPRGRKFAIEGIVDIVRENDRTVMYDLKTHDATSVRQNIEPYEQQLNVYAHIWQNLRGQPLDEMAIIMTALPESIAEAIQTGDEACLADELERWDPVVPVPFDQA
jgi:hypothetical protein